MENVDVKLGAIIKARRKSLGLSQTELAEMVGTTKQCIYYYEKGIRGLSMSLFFKICKVLYLNPNDIQRQIS